jgi:hypothetical protein
MALLGVLVLCIFPFSISIEQAHAQSAQIDNARTALVQAFVLVQEADLQGASVGQISQLADSLNLALHYEENATRLGSGLYADQSLRLSNATAVQAIGVSSAARTQSVIDQASAYSLAVVAGFGSALSVLEIHRLYDIVRKIKLRRIRLE